LNSDFVKKIRDIVSEITGVETSQLVPSAEFETDLNLNRLELAEVIGNLEKRLNIELDPEEIRRVKTFGQLLSIISEKVEE